MDDFEDILKKLRFNHYIFVNGKIKKVGMIEWAIWFENFENRVIDRTDISNFPNYPDGDFVSTVFLGLDHNCGGNGPPVLFETMVFGGKYSQRGWRYSSYGQAKQGHWKIVDCIREGNPPQVEFGERPWIEFFMEMFNDDVDNP